MGLKSDFPQFEKASVVCFLFLIWLMFTCYILQNTSKQMALSSQCNRNRKFMSILGTGPSKIERALFVFLGIFGTEATGVIQTLKPLPGGWEVTEPITVELSCHCSQIIATVGVPISKWFLRIT